MRKSSEDQPISNPGGHMVDTGESLNSLHRQRMTEADLALLNAAWPKLPEIIKAGIIAMVKAAT